MSRVDTPNLTIVLGKYNNRFAATNSAKINVVTKIEAYADNNFIYGIRLYWGSANYLYGSTQNQKLTSLDCNNDPICKVKYYIGGNGCLQGLQFNTSSSKSFSIGHSCSDLYAFKNSANVLTDIIAYEITQNNKKTIGGIQFFYTGPIYDSTLFSASQQKQANNFQVETLSWPALAVLAHTTVVAESLNNVGKLRNRLAIKAPTCDPPLTTSPSDSQLWYRTFRAQENCKEMLLIYLPSILIASTLGYHAFGKWVPRAVGTFALAGAFFRYKYMNAYIEDADKRGKPFYLANMCMKPIFLLAVLSAGYLFGKELYHTVMGHASSSSSSNSSEEEEENE